jgi:hypothetical protein
MRCSPGRWMLGCSLTLSACLVLTTAACSKPAQEAPPAGGSQPAATEQPAAAPGVPAAAQPQAPAEPAAAGRGPEPAPPPPAPRTFTLAEGTVLTIRTSHALSSDTHTAGETFEATLAEPIVEGDWVVAKQGAPVVGMVVASTKGGRVKGVAELRVAVREITLADGQRVRVDTELSTAAAKSEKKKDIGKVAITTGAGALIGGIAGGGSGAAIGAAVGGAGGAAVVMGTRGKPAGIAARSELRFRVTRPVEITEKK